MAATIPTPFVWGSGGRRLTPDEILAERKAAQALGSEAMSTAPVGHWSQGLNRVVQGLMAGYDSSRADAAAQQNAAESAEIAKLLLAGGGGAGSVAIGPVAAAQPTQPGGPNADAIRSGLVQRGLPEHIANGFVKNFQSESGLNPAVNEVAPIVPGSRGGFGLAQWTGPRRVALEQYASLNGKPVSDVNTQLDFLVNELQGSEADAAKSIMATTTPQDAAVAIARDFLRPAPANLDKRVAQYTGATPSASAPAVNPAIAQALTSPYVSDQVKSIAGMLFKQQMDQNKVSTVDLGNAIGVMDARGNLVRQIPKGEPNKGPEYGVIGKDEFGNEQYGWRDPRSQSVTPYKPQATQPAQPSTIPQAPAGVDPKVWREAQSKAAAANGLPGSFDDTHKLRNEFTALPAYKNMAQAAPVYQSMRDAAGRDTKAADLNIVYGLGKIMDPGSVVREGEIQMANNAQGWQEKLNGIIAQINAKGSLTPEGRQALMAEAHSRIMAYKQQYDFDVSRYGGIAERNRINKADVIPDFGTFEPWTAPKNVAPVVIDGYKIKAR